MHYNDLVSGICTQGTCIVSPAPTPSPTPAPTPTPAPACKFCTLTSCHGLTSTQCSTQVYEVDDTAGTVQGAIQAASYFRSASFPIMRPTLRGFKLYGCSSQGGGQGGAPAEVCEAMKICADTRQGVPHCFAVDYMPSTRTHFRCTTNDNVGTDASHYIRDSNVVHYYMVPPNSATCK